MVILRLRRRCAAAIVLMLLYGGDYTGSSCAEPAGVALAAAESLAQPSSMAEMKCVIRRQAAALAEIPGEATPGIASWTMRYANKAADGMLAFDDEMWIKTGLKDIDWSGGQYPHVEWGATLNRFFQMSPLAAAYAKTHDERFARAARAYVEDWMRVDDGFAKRRQRGDNTLNLSIRIQQWARSLPAFLDSAAFDEAFLRSMLTSISTQRRDLSQHLTATNFRIAELDALVMTGLRLPFLDGAKELLDVGVLGMRANLGTQFLPDSVHVERTPGYHDGVTETAFKYALLAKRFPEANAHVDLERLKLALDYAAQSSLCGFADSRLPYRDPEDQRATARRVNTLKALLPGGGVSPYPPLEQVFPSAGHVFARTAWKPGAQYLAFDAGTWGGGHNHLSRLAFTFRAGGRVLVADPGCFTYEMSDPFATYGRSTPAHSTLNLNGGNQGDVDAQLLRTEFASGAAIIHARYQGGYWPGRYTWGFGRGHGQGLFGVHNRTLFWLSGEYLLALDTMNADARSTVHNVWQMGPTDGWSKDESELSWCSKNRDSNLLLRLVPFTGDIHMQCFEGNKEPLRGWIGRNQHEATAAPQVEFRYSCTDGSVTSAVLLAPFAGDKRPAYTVRRTGRAGGRHGGELVYEIELGLPDSGTDLIAWSGSLGTALEELPSTLTTDGTFLWLRRGAADQPLKGFVLDGSFVQYRGQMVYQADKRKATLFGATR